ncbi:MAG: hypothetical protein J7K90_09275, partial [Desulfuromusa sp.]|nr:hypothetical protein [Desulfuromusa sp.]
INCETSPFVQPVNDLICELSRVNFFKHGLLIGSWPMVVYSQVYGLIYGLRTNDIDFAVVNTARKVDGTSLPNLLGQLGYELLTDYQSGIEKYVQDTFEVEFLMHRRGGSAPSAVALPSWQVAAQPLPFIDILFLHPVKVNVEDYSLKIPSPEALMVHKLIIAQRRTGRDKEEKKEKDLQQCASLAKIVRVEEVQWILQEKRISKDVRKDIALSCEETDLEMSELGLYWPRK